jgi:hypothetical protein
MLCVTAGAVMSSYPRIARFRTVADLRQHLAELNAPIPLDDEPLSAAADSPLAQPLMLGGRTVGNRWCIHPMEGWDGSHEGGPTEILLRRWRHFGASGAKLIWGGEAVAVMNEGRANPNQLCAPACGRAGFAALLGEVKAAHREAFGRDDDRVQNVGVGGHRGEDVPGNPPVTASRGGGGGALEGGGATLLVACAFGG